MEFQEFGNENDAEQAHWNFLIKRSGVDSSSLYVLIAVEAMSVGDDDNDYAHGRADGYEEPRKCSEVPHIVKNPSLGMKLFWKNFEKIIYSIVTLYIIP